MSKKSFKKGSSFLEDHQEKSFTEEAAFGGFLKNREDDDIWITVTPESFDVVGVPDAPIVARLGGNEALPTPIHGYVGDDSGLADAMGEYGLVASYFDADDQQVYALPLRFTAIDSLFQQAGVGGSAFRENNAGAVAAEDRAAFITEALHRENRTRRGVMNVLIRDLKMSTVRSAKYQPLSATGLIAALKEALVEPIFNNGTITHEATEAIYSYGTEIDDETIAVILDSKGIKTSEPVERSLRFVTSDTGNNAATVEPFIKIDGVTLPMGRGLKMAHSTGASMGKWYDMLSRVSAILDEVPDNLSRLADIKADCPNGLLAWMINEGGLCRTIVSKKNAQHAIDSVTGVTGLTAFDLYKIAAGLIQDSIDANTTLAKKVNAYEGLARILSSNVAANDYNQSLE